MECNYLQVYEVIPINIKSVLSFRGKRNLPIDFFIENEISPIVEMTDGETTFNV